MSRSNTNSNGLSWSDKHVVDGCWATLARGLSARGHRRTRGQYVADPHVRSSAERLSVAEAAPQDAREAQRRHMFMAQHVLLDREQVLQLCLCAAARQYCGDAVRS